MKRQVLRIMLCLAVCFAFFAAGCTVLAETDSWAPIMPESITPGQDVTVTHIAVEGAESYNVGVWKNGMPVYVSPDIPEPGPWVIPAPVFAEGGEYYIGMGVSNGEYSDWKWGDFPYDVEPFDAETTPPDFTVEKSATDESATLHLSRADAEQIIVQVKVYIYSYYPEIIETWETILVADNPGDSVRVELPEYAGNRVRIATRKDGTWSMWSMPENVGELPWGSFWPSNATVPGEDFPFSIYERKADTIYAAVIEKDTGKIAGTFTIDDGETGVIPGSMLTHTGTYRLSLSYNAEADLTHMEEASQETFHVCAERYAAPTVTITEHGDTIGQEMKIQVVANDTSAEHYLETNIIRADGERESGFWDLLWLGGRPYITTVAGEYVTTPGIYEVCVYAMEQFPDDGETAPSKAPGIGKATCTLADITLPAAPELSYSLQEEGGNTVITVTVKDAEEVAFSHGAFDGAGELMEGSNPGSPIQGDSFTWSKYLSDEYWDGTGYYCFWVRGKYNGVWSEESRIMVPVGVEPPVPLTLPANLERIEDNAFEGSAFQAIIIPDGCTYIGHEAFKDCARLVYVSYPAGTVIEEDAFNGCALLWEKVIREGE